MPQNVLMPKISRLSQECPSPRSARHPPVGSPRCAVEHAIDSTAKKKMTTVQKRTVFLSSDSRASKMVRKRNAPIAIWENVVKNTSGNSSNVIICFPSSSVFPSWPR